MCCQFLDWIVFHVLCPPAFIRKNNLDSISLSTQAAKTSLAAITLIALIITLILCKIRECTFMYATYAPSLVDVATIYAANSNVIPTATVQQVLFTQGTVLLYT